MAKVLLAEDSKTQAFEIKMLLEDAAHEVIHDKVGGLGGDGGIVAIDKDGNVAMEFNTAGMYRAHMNANGDLVIGIYEKE